MRSAYHLSIHIEKAKQARDAHQKDEYLLITNANTAVLSADQKPVMIPDLEIFEHVVFCLGAILFNQTFRLTKHAIA